MDERKMLALAAAGERLADLIDGDEQMMQLLRDVREATDCRPADAIAQVALTIGWVAISSS